MTFRLFINCFSTGFFFGMWMENAWAAGAMFLFLGTLLSLIDYAKQQFYGGRG